MTVREASFADYEQIAAVQAANNLEIESREQWEHLWLGNPAYGRIAGSWPIGWVLEAKDGRIVGTISNIPLTYNFRGRQLTAAAGRGWAVEREYRAFSLLLLGRVVSQPNVDIYLGTTAGGKSAGVYTKLHWSRAPIGRWDRCGFWITQYRGFVQSCIRLASVPGPQLLSYCVAPPLALADKVIRMLSSLHRSEFDLQFSNTFDERFDGFWGDLESRKRHMFLAVRTSDVLNWHFESAMVQNRVWILTACKGAKLIAYGIFERCDKPAFGLKRVRAIDFQALEDDQRLCAAVLSCALDRCRNEGIHILEDRGCWLERAELLNRAAPYHRDLKSWSYFYKTSDPDLGEALEEAGCWDPTCFDGDSSL